MKTYLLTYLSQICYATVGGGSEVIVTDSCEKERGVLMLHKTIRHAYKSKYKLTRENQVVKNCII